MEITFLLCRCGTWKRLGVAFAACGVALVTLGCSFSDYSRTFPTVIQACGATLGNIDASAFDGLVARWTFDQDQASAQAWLDSQQQRTLNVTSRGSGSPALAATQINGSGHAIALDGQSYGTYDGADDDAIFSSQGFTLSAWIALRLEDLALADSSAHQVWPIISTMGSGAQCGGYQLDLRTQGGADGLSLAISYQAVAPSDASVNCADLTRTLVIPLSKPSWAWGPGRWHQVAASYSPLGADQASLKLYWDGERLATPTPIEPIYVGGITYANRTLRVGASGEAIDEGTESLLPANMDDVAIFNRALSDAEIADFNVAASTRPGPAGCRWNAAEEWDFVSKSSSTWAPASSAVEPRIQVTDLDWGAGFLSARLNPELDLSSFSRAYVSANVPQGLYFVFSLAVGDDSCNWMMLGNGASRYVVDLAKPSFCVSTNCSFNMDRVQWVRVSSDWASAENYFSIAVTGLEFEASALPLEHPLAQGGVIGPKGWCWRPQAYDPNSQVTWVDASPQLLGSVSARLSGDANTTARLVADFGDQLLDLRGCSRVEIDAALPLSSTETPYFSLVIGTSAGAERQWRLSTLAPTYSLDLNKFTWDSNSDPKFAHVPEFDPSKVRIIGIEKPYEYRDEPDVSIADVRFYAADGSQNCEVASQP